MTVAVISSSAAAVSSRLAACCSVRRDRSSAALDISSRSRLDRTRAVGDLQQRGLQFLEGKVEVKAKFFESRKERLIDPVFKVPVGQSRQPRSDLVHGANALGDVRREFDDLHDLLVHVENGIVGGLNPHLLAALAEALELGGDKLARVQFSPKILVVGRLRISRFDKEAMVLALNFFETIAERAQKILVGGDDFAARHEFDDRLNAGDRVDLAFEFRVLEFSAVMSVATLTTLRTCPWRSSPDLRRLNPDFSPAFADALVFARVKFAAAELVPERPVVGCGTDN